MRTPSLFDDDEYLALERAATTKHEMVNGHVPATGLHAHPDVSIVYGDLALHAKDAMTYRASPEAMTSADAQFAKLKKLGA